MVFFDALRVKIRDEGLVRNKAVYLALGITCQGEKEVLGLWIEQTEGAKFWLKVMNELRTRGAGDVLIAVVDDLTGFPDAIATVFPQTAVQTCIVGLLKNPVCGNTVASGCGLEVRLGPCWRPALVTEPIRRGGGGPTNPSEQAATVKRRAA